MSNVEKKHGRVYCDLYFVGAAFYTNENLSSLGNLNIINSLLELCSNSFFFLSLGNISPLKPTQAVLVAMSSEVQVNND